MIPAAEFAHRRRQLMRMAGADAAIIVAAAAEQRRNADNFYPYRQDSDFHYLTGFPEPDAVLLLLPGREAGEVVAFCRQHDAIHERWNGARIGTDGAVRDYGMDDAFPIEDIDDIAPGMIEGRRRIYCHFGSEPDFDARLLAWLRRLRSARGAAVVPKEVLALGYLLHDLRLYKSRNELRLMRRAAKVALAAHRAALACVRPGALEHEVEAELLKTIRAQGAVPSYPPMVAGGVNACTMHYHVNDSPLVDGDLLMIDAGAEVECYASDITRTVPVNGRWSKPQRALYDLVLAAQDAAIAQAWPGRPFSAAHEAAAAVVIEGLCALKLIPDSVRSTRASGVWQRYFPHKTCHWLGLDVHDVGDYRVDGEPRILEPGMVLAIEPGLYIAPNDRDVTPRWRGLAVRVEDDVVVTRDGPQVLSAAMPRDPDNIVELLPAM